MALEIPPYVPSQSSATPAVVLGGVISFPCPECHLVFVDMISCDAHLNAVHPSTLVPPAPIAAIAPQATPAAAARAPVINWDDEPDLVPIDDEANLLPAPTPLNDGPPLQVAAPTDHDVDGKGEMNSSHNNNNANIVNGDDNNDNDDNKETAIVGVASAVPLPVQSASAVSTVTAIATAPANSRVPPPIPKTRPTIHMVPSTTLGAATSTSSPVGMVNATPASVTTHGSPLASSAASSSSGIEGRSHGNNGINELKIHREIDGIPHAPGGPLMAHSQHSDNKAVRPVKPPHIALSVPMSLTPQSSSSSSSSSNAFVSVVKPTVVVDVPSPAVLPGFAPPSYHEAVSDGPSPSPSRAIHQPVVHLPLPIASSTIPIQPTQTLTPLSAVVPYPPQPSPAPVAPPLVSTPSGSAHPPIPPSYAALAQAPLPPGWEQALDPASGRVVYVNHALRETRWDRPGAPAVTPNQSSNNRSIASVAPMPLPPNALPIDGKVRTPNGGPRQGFAVASQPNTPNGGAGAANANGGYIHVGSPQAVNGVPPAPAAAGGIIALDVEGFADGVGADGLDTRPTPGAPWRPPPWFRRRVEDRNPWTYFHHCFFTCLSVTYCHCCFCMDSGTGTTLFVPRVGAGGRCECCATPHPTDPGCASYPFNWLAQILTFPIRFLLLGVWGSFLFFLLAIDLAVILSGPLFCFCCCQCLPRKNWCTFSFGEVNAGEKRARFRYPSGRGFGCWVGFMKVFCCYLEHRQRHYSVCPTICTNPSDQDYVALRVDD